MRVKLLQHLIKYDDIIKQYQGRWWDIARHRYLTNQFIDQYFFKLKPYNIQYYQRLSPYLMFKYGDNLNWVVMSKTQDIPQILIRKYQNKVNWWYISQYQNMNDQFIRQYLSKLKVQKLRVNKKLVGRMILNQI